MFNLKSIYFYFLALYISIIKFLKKIYFSTNIYNNSLKSKTPKQFYFHPNPFLLSSITNYKKHSFKISKLDPNVFWIKKNNTWEEKELHSFLWLNLIDRKNDGKSLQNIINSWIIRYSIYKKNLWENSVLSRRIISWILNAEIILKNGSFYFKRNFLNSIISQANHLKKNIKFEKSYTKKLEIFTALILTGLVFKEYRNNFDIGIKELEKLVKTFFDKDGFPFTRNPTDLIFFSKYLMLSRRCIEDAHEYVPEFLDLTLDDNFMNLKKIMAPNNQTPLFNGGTEIDLEEFNKFLAEKKNSLKKKKNLIGGIHFFINNKIALFFEAGEPPKKNFSQSYQSGPLSFEYYLEGSKIITNCGFGSNISSKAELLSRLTSAQSTLTLNDASVTKFERNKLINKIFGNSIKNTFKINNYEHIESNRKINFIASHNGYEKEYGCIHKRELSFDKLENKLTGTDEIQKRKDGKPISYNLRFHLYPGLTAVKTMSGNSVLIQISKNKSLLFTVKDESIILEKSIFLGGNKILDNTCITVSGNLVNKDKIFHWEIKKNI
tara:strand:- start:2526 stop:4172 length:1647 start_codon:yes stop_codon:yes gene_type:complete